jgi:hypothetical protein
MPPHLRATQQEAHKVDDRWQAIEAAENDCVEKDFLGDGVEFFAAEGEVDESGCTLDECDAFFAVEAVLLEWWEAVYEEVLSDLKEDLVGEVE